MQNNGAIFSVNKSAELGWLSQTIKIDRSAEFAGKLAASKKKQWHGRLPYTKTNTAPKAAWSQTHSALTFSVFLPDTDRRRVLASRTSAARARKINAHSDSTEQTPRHTTSLVCLSDPKRTHRQPLEPALLPAFSACRQPLNYYKHTLLSASTDGILPQQTISTSTLVLQPRTHTHTIHAGQAAWL